MRDNITKLCETVVAAADGILHTLSTCWRYDETPMEMTLIGQDLLYGLPDEVLERLEQVPNDATNTVGERDTGVAKLLQSEVVVGALVRMHLTWVLFTWMPPLPLLCMARTTTSKF
eukprot:6427405-Pyramimonas_sp.AAC.2